MKIMQKESTMYRTNLVLIVALSVLIVFSGCAKKPLQVETAPPPEPPAASEPAMIEEPVPAAIPDQKDPLVDAGLFALDAGDLNSVYFDYDSYRLSATAMAELKSNAELLRNDPAFRVTIEGHCDQRGSDEYNLSLGELRAHAVLSYLASLGIERERLTVISYGEERPAAAGSDEAAWAKNRRVAFD
jgi:peptidoglycan-associated lipoprotein